MKNIIVVLVFVFLFSVTGALAQQNIQGYTAIVPSVALISEWVSDFIDSYNENDVYQAVAEAVEDGVTPVEIVENGLEIEGMNPQNLTAALYCAGAKPEDIRVAATNNGISDIVLVAGFETAKTVCGDDIADTQAFTPLGPAFAGVPGGNEGGQAFGSVSGFVQ
jgi:hypothetical protein